jgi:16S rRNA (cytidine1402-2'-O)-methyltransferase
VVTTPIGNMGDITLRALEVLAAVNLIAAEDTRHTRRLLAHHRITNELISYHEHNELRRTETLIEKLADGAAIALVSDAGTPTVSDPGYRLVRAAAEHRIPVTPIPGVSAAMAALAVSGLPTDQFTFVGFPLRKKQKRAGQLAGLAPLPHTLIFYQSPRRLIPFMHELKAALGDRQAVLAREMTKLHEEFVRGCLSEIIATLDRRDAVKGECTLLVAGADPVEHHGEAEIEDAIRAAVAAGEQPLSDIAKALAGRFNIARKTVYEKALDYRRQMRK